MKKLGSIGLLLILVLIVSSPAISQSKSSATQTVTFAVNHSAKLALNVLKNFSSISSSLNSSETTMLQNSLKKMSVKVTIAETSTHATAVSKNASDVHMDVRSVLQAGNSATIDRIPTVVTVTE
jgi:hypothetical protein